MLHEIPQERQFLVEGRNLGDFLQELTNLWYLNPE